MCGFAGLFTSAVHDGTHLDGVVRRMVAPLAHRGPDDAGLWTDAERGIGLGFRRLSIVDLSASGHQPMQSASGRYWMVFNGEVFNHGDLRRDLLAVGRRFRGHSDTEVMLAAFEEWGIEASVRRFIGMFAIALWDTHWRELSLIRDRLGIKPLFVYHRGGLTTFGSELKALVAEPSFDRTLDRDALTSYLRYLYIPAPRTIYRHAAKLRPGHILTIASAAAPLPESRPYWSVEEVAERGLADQFEGSEREAIDELDRLIGDAVRLRMEADVPVGALLSGGIDSSVVVSMMQQQSSRPIKTFSVAFDVAEHNEAPHAAALSKHLGTDHTEMTLTGEDALAVVPKLPEIFDEPHADTSQIPAFLVCEVARREVTVALTGDGGDEVFGGYNRYTYGERMLGRMLSVPKPARRVLAAGIGRLSSNSWARAHRAVTPMLPASLQQRLAGEKLAKVGRMMSADSIPHMYRSLVSAWQAPGRIVVGGSERDDIMERVLTSARPARLLDRMMLADQLTYLADDQLAKVDRVSMAVSLEARVPLLDHRLVEFSWRLPADMKIREGTGKRLLREVLYRHVPKALVERPKMGLSVPLEQWLRGPLRPWAEDLLSPAALERDGILHAAPIRRSWAGLLAGRGDESLALWSVLVFQAWRQRWLD